MMAATGATRARLVRADKTDLPARPAALPEVGAWRGRRVEFDAAPGVARIEIDGEPLGTAPALLEVLPAAISILVPRP